MIDFVSNNKELLGTEAICQQFIISGGVKDFLHGHHLMNKLKGVCVYGQAHAFLIHAANSYEDLQSFINSQLDGLKMAKAYLTNRDH
jgi:isopentenyl-diphosphate delta-isomerase